MKAFISIFTIFFSAIIVSILTSLYVLLVKQMEIMNLDSSSYQALFVADSAFECVVYKEQQANAQRAAGEDAFAFVNFSGSEYCLSTGDLTGSNLPEVTNSPSRRVKGVFNLNFKASSTDYCAIINTDKEIGVTALFASAPDPDVVTISAVSKSCSEPQATKAIERFIEFYY